MELLRLPGLPLLVLALLFLLESSAALPTTSFNKTSDPKSLLRRECVYAPENKYGWICDLAPPTLDQIIGHMYDPNGYGGMVTETSRVFFYSNLGEREVCVPWMLGWLKSQKIDEYYWADNAVEAWYDVQWNWIEDNFDAFANAYDDKEDPQIGFQVCYVEALASAALHPTAYLFTVSDQEPLPNSIWTTVEFPALTRNPRIKEVYRVDPRPPDVKKINPDEDCKHDAAVLLWSRERGDPEIKPARRCPLGGAKAGDAATTTAPGDSPITTSSGDSPAATPSADV